jgi:hypothetical protein
MLRSWEINFPTTKHFSKSPQTVRAVSTTNANLRHWSSSVKALHAMYSKNRIVDSNSGFLGFKELKQNINH